MTTPGTAHSSESIEFHARLLSSSPATGRHVELASGRRAHVIEAGAGEPLVLLHPGGTSALVFMPLIERLTGLRVIGNMEGGTDDAVSVEDATRW
jgi:hypothetical protein